MIEALEREPRFILKAQLSPTVGSAFQPTGFPDLGAAEFERPGAGENGEPQQALLVESVQSMANHLEHTTQEPGGDGQPVKALARLPYIEVRDAQDRFVTSSRLEPHRLAGAYIKNAMVEGEKAGEWMISRLGVQKGVPADWRAIYRAIFQLDPLCLVHGVFFSDPQWKNYGNPKVRRAVTAVIEAHGVRPLVSGGVKRDDVNPTKGESRGSKEGYGFVPFGRTEYTAEKIELSASVDLEQIRGYGLETAETRLLTVLALWELRMLLDGPLRLRTACDLEVNAVAVTRPDGVALPDADALTKDLEDTSVNFDEEGALTVRSE